MHHKSAKNTNNKPAYLKIKKKYTNAWIMNKII